VRKKCCEHCRASSFDPESIVLSILYTLVVVLIELIQALCKGLIDEFDNL
jgi:hypothetical protein